jgi:pimeloyl-ACP methyl ester carboxylesterase
MSLPTFIHGWGCSSTIWPSVPGHFFDRGYFKHPRPLISSKKIVVHSFGLHLIPMSHFNELQELVILSSFITFVTKKRIVEQMLKRFSVSPYDVLSDFLGAEVDEEIDKNLLEMDLKALSVNIFDTEVIKNVPTVKIIHGRLDHITPFAWGEELHQKIPQSQFFPFEGGHFESVQEGHRRGLF